MVGGDICQSVALAEPASGWSFNWDVDCMSHLSSKAESILKQISEGQIPCHRFNRQILEKLRQSGYLKIVVKRTTAVPERFCKITPEGLRYLEEEVTP